MTRLIRLAACGLLLALAACQPEPDASTRTAPVADQPPPATGTVVVQPQP